jgi:hypothetical protein
MQTEVTIDRYGAFSVNRVGLEGPGFPLSFSASVDEDIALIHGTALRAFDLVALFRTELQATVVLLNIGHTWTNAGGRIRAPSDIASAQGRSSPGSQHRLGRQR